MNFAKTFLILTLSGTVGAETIVAEGYQSFYQAQLPNDNAVFSPLDNEPNDTYLTANTLVLNGSVSGNLNHETDYYDYYKVTTPNDGKIEFTIIPGASLDAYLDLYDQDGTSFLTYSIQTGVGVTDTLIYRNLKAGTYFIRVGGGGDGAYTLNNVFTPTAIPNGNDAEPNDTPAEFVPIDYNISTTGHLGYFGNGSIDYYDFYLFSIPFDGKISFTIIPENTLDAYIDLYDQDGTSFLRYSIQTGVGVNDTLIYGNLKAGTYFIRIGGGGYGSYTLNNVFTATSIPKGNDIEPNDTQAESVSMNINSSVTGHLYFFGNGTADYYDYYSFTNPSDGKIAFKLSPENTLDGFIDLYDQNGTSFLRYSIQTGIGVNDTLIYENLKAGTYFIGIGGSGYGSYTLNNAFTPTKFPDGNDAEPNDTQTESVSMNINSSVTGHLNYFGNGTADYSDFYSFTNPSDGKIAFILIPENMLDGSINLYDQNGTSFLRYSIQTGIGVNDTLIYENLKAGTYFIDIGGSGYGSYTLNNAFTPTSIPNGNDIEPNGTSTEANSININSPKTGHINYFGNGSIDNYDFYSFSIPAKGKITSTLVPENTLDAYIDLYDQNGTTFLRYSSQTGSGVTDTLIYDNLDAGTYYIGIGGIGYGSYTLNLSFTESGLSVENPLSDQVKIIPDIRNGILVIDNVPDLDLRSVEIIDVSGKTIMKEKLFNTNNQVYFSGKKGLFLVKVSTGKKIIVRKIVF